MGKLRLAWRAAVLSPVLHKTSPFQPPGLSTSVTSSARLPWQLDLLWFLPHPNPPILHPRTLISLPLGLRLLLYRGDRMEARSHNSGPTWVPMAPWGPWQSSLASCSPPKPGIPGPGPVQGVPATYGSLHPVEANSECRPNLPEFKPHPHYLAAEGPLLWSAFPYLKRPRRRRCPSQDCRT